MGPMEPWSHGIAAWLIKDNGDGAVERPARESMMPPTGSTHVLLLFHGPPCAVAVLYCYLDPMEEWMNQCRTHSTTQSWFTHSHVLSIQHAVGPDQSASLNHRH